MDSINRKDALTKLNMNAYVFRTITSELLEENILEMIGKGPSTKYILKRSSPEQSYMLKRALKKIEDFITREAE